MKIILQGDIEQSKNVQKNESVDFVLAYVDNNNQSHMQRREVFEDGLLDQGLELEYEQNRQLCFVKIHAPKVSNLLLLFAITTLNICN